MNLHFYKEGEIDKESDIKTGILGIFISPDQGVKDTLIRRRAKKLPRTNHAFTEDSPFAQVSPSILLRITDPEKAINPKNKEKIGDSEYQRVIEQENKKSGKILGIFPFRNDGRDDDLGLIVFTENGAACILFGWRERSSILAVSGAFGELVNQTMTSKRMTKQEASVRALLDKYPASLIAGCFENSIFIPYEKINDATLNMNKSLLFMRFGDVYIRKMNLNKADLGSVKNILLPYSY